MPSRCHRRNQQVKIVWSADRVEFGHVHLIIPPKGPLRGVKVQIGVDENTPLDWSNDWPGRRYKRLA